MRRLLKRAFLPAWVGVGLNFRAGYPSNKKGMARSDDKSQVFPYSPVVLDVWADSSVGRATGF